MRFHSYFNTAIRILRLYDGSISLSHFLRQYFSGNKKHGAKDRKFITHACYSYFRPGHALQKLQIEERLKAAIFLCNEIAAGWSVLYDEDWVNQWSSSLDERISFLKSTHSSFSLNDVFHFTSELSEGIDTTSFVQSHFVQPDVFLRIRPRCREQVMQTLQQNAIPFAVEADDGIRLAPTINVENLLKPDKEVVVQDASSQQIKKFLEPVHPRIMNPQSQILNPLSVWDCCAGSGGKSILAYDMFPSMKLTVTDIRPSIIHNLRKRFQNAGINQYRASVIDVTNTVDKALSSKSGAGFDLIICDAPCTGSGTWSRTPEQLFFFTGNKIDDYAALQRKIVSNAIPCLKAGAYFLYITCSVFRKENEEIVGFIKSKFHLQLVKMELLKGYNKKADTMFAALFSSDTIAPPV